MAKKTIRTPAQQEYRDNLAKQIRELRSQGDTGKKIAKVLLEKEKLSEKYVDAKNGVTKEQLQLQLDEKLEKGKSERNSIVDMVGCMYRENIKLTEQQDDKLKNIILELYDHDWIGREDVSALKFLMQYIGIFSQKNKEELARKAIAKYRVGMRGSHRKEIPGNLYRMVRSGTDKDAYGNKDYGEVWSAGSNVVSLIIESLKESTNEVFLLDMCLFMDERGYISKSKIPENCISVLSDPDNLKKAIEGRNYNKGSILSVLNELGIFTKLEELYGDMENKGKVGLSINTIKKIFGDKIFEDSINNGGKMLSFLVRLVGVKNYRKELDYNYKTPKFVNAHKKELSPLLQNGGWISLLEDMRDTKSIKGDEEKFDISIIEEKIKNLSDYEKSLVKQYTNFLKKSPKEKLASFGAYHFEQYEVIKNVGGDVFEEYLSRIIDALNSSSKYAKDYERTQDDSFYYKTFYTYMNEFLEKYANTILQDIYATGNKDLFFKLRDELFRRSYCDLFFKNLSEENLNHLIKRIIKTIDTKKDYEEFNHRIVNSYPEKYSILAVILYYVRPRYWDSERVEYMISKMEEIPGNLYLDFVKSCKLDTGGKTLPKVGKDIYIDSYDLERLLKLKNELIKDKEKAKEKEEEEDENLKKLKKERENLENEVIQNREKGDVILNYTSYGQKYILVIDTEKHNLQFLSEDLEYHANIYGKYMKDKNSICLGGGRVHMDDNEKIIKLYGYSQAYGSVSSKYKGAMKKMLEKKFPDYQIIC